MRPSSSRAAPPLPRPHARVVADLVASVRECEREVFKSKAWRSLLARLDESEEDFEEEEVENENENGGALASCPSSFSFRNVSRLTVLGLGSLEGSKTPRLQAALALLLARERFPKVLSSTAAAGGSGEEEGEEEEEEEEEEEGKGGEEGEEEEGKGEEAKQSNCLFAADPVFSAADRDALTELGFCVVAPEEAVEAGRAKSKNNDEEEEGNENENELELSFFYLPHCYPAVAEDVLRAHWNAESLGRVVILGNSLSGVAEKVKERMRREKEKEVSSSAAAMTTTTTTPRCLAAGSKPCSSYSSSLAIIEASVVGPDLDAAEARSGLGAAFNDTALHLFPRWTKEFAEI